MRNIEKYRRGWRSGLPETPCGIGSQIRTTEKQRKWLLDVVAKYQIRTVADIGAGDLNWIRLVGWPDNVVYRAYDIVPRHPSVIEFDLVSRVAPSVDLLLVLWVLNHLTDDECTKAIDNILASESNYLIVSDRQDRRLMVDDRLAQLETVDAVVLNAKTEMLRLVRL